MSGDRLELGVAPAIRSQAVAAAVGAMACSAATSAWSRYGEGGASTQGRSRSRASVTSTYQRERSWSGSSTGRPSTTRASRRECWSSIRASSASTSTSASTSASPDARGQDGAEHADQPDRLAGDVGPDHPAPEEGRSRS